MKNSVDMLHGPLLGKIVRFALPLAATNVLQQLFNSADVAVVGKFAGADSLAAVGATTPVTNLFINLFVGLAVGANVVVARSLGRNDKESARRAVSTAMVTAVVCGFIMVLLGFTVTKPLLRLMATPESVTSASTSFSARASGRGTMAFSFPSSVASESSECPASSAQAPWTTPEIAAHWLSRLPCEKSCRCLRGGCGSDIRPRRS